MLLSRKRWVYQHGAHILVHHRTSLTSEFGKTNHFFGLLLIKMKNVLIMWMCSMQNHTTLSVSTLLQAGEASVGWALGYILSVSSLLPEEPTGIRKGLCPAAWICLLILLTILLTATVCYMALLVIWRKRRNGGVS